MLAKKLLGAAKSAVVDAYYNLVTLLLPGNGTNGAQNNTFLDSSTNNFTITRNGNTTQGTFSPFSQTGWGNFFDGSGDYLTIPDNSAFDVGSGDFSIECWVYPTASASTTYLVSQVLGSTGAGSYVLWVDGSGYPTFYSTTGGTTSTRNDITSGTLLSLNAWTHLCICRSGSTLSLYQNGTRVATQTYSSTIFNSTNNIGIGGDPTGNILFTGYISNVRLVKGSSAYDAAQSSLTVPTAALTAITNTSLLTCQSNRFLDNSTNAFAITRNGDVSVQAFSPFLPTAAYSASTVGGSGYFDGTGDSLEIADNTAFTLDGDFTIEGWLYPFSVADSDNFIAKWQPSNQEYLFWPESGVPKFYWAPNSAVTALLTSSVSIPTNAWTHLAVTRSGNSFTMWVNGVSRATATNSSAVTNTSSPVEIGRLSQYPPNYDYQGYMEGVRIVKGTAVYTTGFAPPTSPVTAITNTSLLLNFTNAGITDATSKNVLETVGNAQISTAQSKFGGSSMYFDGTGDWLISRTNSALSVGSGNFTIEFWVYLTGSGTNSFVDTRVANDAAGVLIQTDTSRYLRLFTNGSGQITDTVALTQNQWVHVALVRSSTTTTLYKDGTSIGTYSDSNNYNAGGITVGSNFGLTTPMTGYIDDLRITKGYARYTANFTPPTAPFALQ